MTLRQDERQWLIYQEDSVTQAVRALEVFAMLIAGPVLAKHPEQSMRALGNMMIRLAAERESFMLKSDGLEATAGQHVATILGEIAGVADASDAKDELHAAMFWLDSTLKNAGINTGSWMAEVALGNR
jgi:hypothetical protein